MRRRLRPLYSADTDPVIGAAGLASCEREHGMTASSPSNTLVTIFGGSGFLGRHLVRALAKRGYRIRVAVRRPELAGHLQPLGRVGQIHAVQANLRYPASVEAAVRDADVVINLVGILFERGRQRFEAVQARRRGGGAARQPPRRAADPRLRARRRRELALALCPHQGGGREGGARGRAGGDHLPSLDPVRPGGRLLQPLRRHGAAFAGAAADRRRAHPFQPVFVGDVAGADRRARSKAAQARARPTSSAGRR